jgi:hypothetical protein
MNRSTSFLAGLFLITCVLASTVASAGSPRETLSKEALNASAWAVAGLEESVPADIRRNLTFLREDLLDEGSAASQANAASYKLGSALCDALIAALDEREQASVRAGYRAAQANAATKVTSADLEVRRNYSMSWPQYAREQSQRSELTRQMNNQTSLAKEAVRVEWSTRAAQLRRNLDELYRRYREALRQNSNFQMSNTSVPQAIETPAIQSRNPVPPSPSPFVGIWRGRTLNGKSETIYTIKQSGYSYDITSEYIDSDGSKSSAVWVITEASADRIDFNQKRAGKIFPGFLTVSGDVLTVVFRTGKTNLDRVR